MKKKKAIISVVTSDYFWEATVLGKSVKEFETESDFIVFVIDYDINDPDYQSCGFQVLDAKILNPEEWDRFLFQYDGFSACCALKPQALLYALTHYEKVIYLDNDMKLFAPLETAWGSLDRASLSLTPQNNKPIDNDGLTPSYISIRVTGVFNAGYLGASSEAHDFLEWWWKQTHYNCIFEPMIGIFVDQLYLNEAVTMVEDLFILRDKAYNVACWNLHERCVERHGDCYIVNGRPLVLFHFSNPNNFDELKTIRVTEKHGNAFLELYSKYEKELAIAKKEFSPKQYHYSSFQDGTSVSPEWRELMRRDIPELKEIHNPFHLRVKERLVIEKTMLQRPDNFHPNKYREINDWENSILAGSPSVKKIISDLQTPHALQEKMRGLEWKLARFENSFPHQLLSKAIDSVKALLRKTCYKFLVD